MTEAASASEIEAEEHDSKPEPARKAAIPGEA